MKMHRHYEIKSNNENSNKVLVNELTSCPAQTVANLW